MHTWPCHVTQGPCLTHSHPGSRPSCVMNVFLLHTQFSALTKIELFYLQKTKMLIFSYLHSPLCKYKILISLLYCFRMFDFKTWCLSYTHTLTWSLNVFCLELEDDSWNFLKWPKNQHWWLKYKILINSKIALHHILANIQKRFNSLKKDKWIYLSSMQICFHF